MIQRKQTLYLLAAIVMTVICLCMQIGSFKGAGLEVARVYNLWFTDPLALFCLFNALLIIGWYVCFFVISQVVGDKSWGTVDFRPTWPAVFPAIAFVLYLMARRAINADEKLVRSMDRIR